MVLDQMIPLPTRAQDSRRPFDESTVHRHWKSCCWPATVPQVSLTCSSSLVPTRTSWYHFIIIVKGTAFQPVLPPKLQLLYRILVATLFSCTIRELWLCVIFPHVKCITSPYQNIFPFHNLVCYDIVTPSFWFSISANLDGSMSYPVLSSVNVSTLFY